MLNERVDDLLLRLPNGCSQFLIQELFRDLEIFRIRRCAFLSLRNQLQNPLFAAHSGNRLAHKIFRLISHVILPFPNPHFLLPRSQPTPSGHSP